MITKLLELYKAGTSIHSSVIYIVFDMSSGKVIA